MRNILKLHNRLFFVFILISALGLLNIFSVSRSFGEILFIRHVSYVVIGVLFYFIFSRIKIPEWKELSYVFFTIAIFLLIFVLLKEKGVKRWLHIAGFSFQVSDAVKPLIIYFLSMMWFKNKKSGYMDSFYLFFLHSIPFILVLLEPDLGSAGYFIFLFGIYLLFSRFELKVKLLYIFSFLSLILSFNFVLFLAFSALSLLYVIFNIRFITGDKLFLTLAILMPGLTVPFVFNNVLKEYQRKRIIYFLNPSKDPRGAGWQILQGKLAIGSGGIFGKGFLKGTHKSLAFLPQAHSDFAFSSFAEEFGFIGSSFLILLYFLLLRDLFNLSLNLRGFSSYFVLGVFASIFYSFFTNLGGVLGLLPLTGIPLTFFSYGGTNFVIHSMLIGMSVSFMK